MYLHFLSNNPLSCPARRDALLGAPSPWGKVWEGGNKYLRNYFFIHDTDCHFYKIINIRLNKLISSGNIHFFLYEERQGRD